MQTTATAIGWTADDRGRARRAMGATFLVAGLLALLAALSLLVLFSNPGRNPVVAPVAVAVEAPAPADLDDSWLCGLGSDDSGSMAAGKAFCAK